METFTVGQVVKGARCGTFVVLGYRMLGGERMVQVKPVDPRTGKMGRGEMAFTESALRA